MITKNTEQSMKTKEPTPKAGDPSISLYPNAPFGQGDFTSLCTPSEGMKKWVGCASAHSVLLKSVQSGEHELSKKVFDKS
jgi:hypothetical protein